MQRPIIRPAGLAPIIGQVVLLDARPRERYLEGHLPGAIHADLESQLSTAADAGADPKRGGRHPLPPIERWARQLGTWGIEPRTNVVIYDDQCGANAAARAWWMLKAVGHEHVAVLDGGLPAAIESGMETSIEIPQPQSRGPYPAEAWKRPVVDMAAVDRLRRDESWCVLDVRSSERFRGETEPIDPIAGHIPGAVNLPYGENLEDDRFKSPPELRRQYERLLGDLQPDHLVVHCGSGVTACHTLLALEAAGLEGAALYVGSWSEWCRNELPRSPDR